MESVPRFFSKKVPELHNTEEVSNAVEKHTRLSGEKVSNTPEAKLGVYMSRLENIFLNRDEEVRKRNIELLRGNIHEAFVIKSADVPNSYFELQQRIARERGQAVEIIPDEVKEQMREVIIEDQTKSLDEWVDYLTSNDAVYPTWFKYLVFRNIVKLSQFDKELGKFKERTKSTTAPFPDIYREVLAQLCDVYERAASDDKELLKDPLFQDFVAKKFPTQYAELILKNLEQSQENIEEIKGQWVKYQKGDMEGAKKLYESLQGKGTGWCTAGESTAQSQLESGDFYVYYTNDVDGNPVNPRLAIRMSDTHVSEVRGVLPHQEVESRLQETLDTKLSEFGTEAEKYKKKSADMRRLTEIEAREKQGLIMTKEDLLFLYEIDDKIEGFGYSSDPRIKEIKEKRDRKKDLAVIFDCSPESIVEDSWLINEQTRLYIKKHTSKSNFTGEKKESFIIFDLMDEKNTFARVFIKKFLEVESNLKLGKTPSVEDLKFIWKGALSEEDIKTYVSHDMEESYKKQCPYPFSKRDKITLRARSQGNYFDRHLSEEVHILHRLQKNRNRKDDFAVMGGYAPDEIAEDCMDIDENTKGVLRGSEALLIDYGIDSLPREKVLILADVVKKIKGDARNFQPYLEIDHGVVEVVVPKDEIESLSTALSHYISKEDDSSSLTDSYRAFSEDIYQLPFTEIKSSSFNAVFIEHLSTIHIQGISIDQFVEQLKDVGLRPATFSELLAFGIANPRLVESHSYIKTVGAKLIVDDKVCIPMITTEAESGDEDSPFDYEPQKVLEFAPVEEITKHENSVYICVYE